VAVPAYGRPGWTTYRLPVATTYTVASPTYAAPSYAAPTYAAPTYAAPAYTVPAAVGPRVWVKPKVYVEGQPIRNILRAITP
jgi:hypothetical protein